MDLDEEPREYEEDIDAIIKSTLGSKELSRINQMSHATSVRQQLKHKKRK